MKSFRELTVWHDAMELAKQAYRLTATLPDWEKYGLRSQIQRAATSVPANIAEGHARLHRNEYVQFIGIAGGSLAELTTLVLLAKDLHGLQTEEIELQCDKVGKMLTRLRQSLTQKPNPQSPPADP